MEKISKEEQQRGSSRWINVLTFLTVIQTAVFLSVTLVTVSKIFIDDNSLTEQRCSSRWINVLTFLTVIQTAIFLSVTLVTVS